MLGGTVIPECYVRGVSCLGVGLNAGRFASVTVLRGYFYSVPLRGLSSAFDIANDNTSFRSLSSRRGIGVRRGGARFSFCKRFTVKFTGR